MSYQQILIRGNLTRDAEVRQVGQSQVAKIGVAVSEKFRKQDGTIGENAEFFDVEIWDKPGIYPYLTKGQSVLVVGKQKTDRWQDQQTGQNREAKKVRGFDIQLCGSKPQSEQTGTAPAPGYAPQGQPAYAPQTYQARPVSAPPTPPTPPNYPAPPTPPGGYTPTPPPGSEQYRDLPPDF